MTVDRSYRRRSLAAHYEETVLVMQKEINSYGDFKPGRKANSNGKISRNFQHYVYRRVGKRTYYTAHLCGKMRLITLNIPGTRYL